MLIVKLKADHGNPIQRQAAMLRQTVFSPRWNHYYYHLSWSDTFSYLEVLRKIFLKDMLLLLLFILWFDGAEMGSSLKWNLDHSCIWINTFLLQGKWRWNATFLDNRKQGSSLRCRTLTGSVSSDCLYS